MKSGTVDKSCNIVEVIKEMKRRRKVLLSRERKRDEDKGVK